MPKIIAFEKPKAEHRLKEELLFTETRRAQDILKTMDEDTYEELVASWAYWCLKEDYEDVMRIGGSGDKGIDVIAYYSQEVNKCDIYQCKHYDHPVRKSDVIAELGKFLYFMFIGEIPIPESYYLMAPQGLSSQFLNTYENSIKLKTLIEDSWNKDIAGKIEIGKVHLLEGDLKKFIEDFDYTKYKFYSQNKFLKILVEADKRFVYFQYFGFHKEFFRKIVKDTPIGLDEYEKKYIQHLLDAYNDAKGGSEMDESSVESSSFGKHFARSRDEFWLAESIRKMSEENNPGDTDEFANIMDEMEGHVADTYEGVYDNAFERVKAVTGKSTSMPPKGDWVVSGQLGAKELKGICFQLSNEDRLIWKEDEKF